MTLRLHFSLFTSKNTARAKQLTLGRKKFNMDPKKGIEFLVQQGLLQNTPQDIAAFLYRFALFRLLFHRFPLLREPPASAAARAIARTPDSGP